MAARTAAGVSFALPGVMDVEKVGTPIIPKSTSPVGVCQSPARGQSGSCERAISFSNLGLAESVLTRERLADHKRVHLIGSLIGANGFEVHHVTHDRVLIGHAVTTKN